MRKWSDISLFKFQEVQRINAREIPEIDKVLFSVCAVFDFTEYQLDKMPWPRVQKMMARLTKIFQNELKPAARKRIGRYVIEYNFDRMTFGQYIELAFFFKLTEKDPVLSAHYCLASVSRLPFHKHNSEGHKKRNEYFLTRPVTDIIGSLKLLAEAYGIFNKEHDGLFGLSEEVHGERGSERFNRRYGWEYSAEEVMKLNNISLEQTYALPARVALNQLMYLKEKGEYLNKLMRENSKQNGG
jgi:hypothetical protein